MKWKYALSEVIENRAKENPKRYTGIILSIFSLYKNASYQKHTKVDIKEMSKRFGISVSTYYKALKILLEDKIISKDTNKYGYYIFNEDTINDAITAYDLAHPLKITEHDQAREEIINTMFKKGYTTDDINLINNIL